MNVQQHHDRGPQNVFVTLNNFQRALIRWWLAAILAGCSVLTCSSIAASLRPALFWDMASWLSPTIREIFDYPVFGFQWELAVAYILLQFAPFLLLTQLYDFLLGKLASSSSLHRGCWSKALAGALSIIIPLPATLGLIYTLDRLDLVRMSMGALTSEDATSLETLSWLMLFGFCAAMSFLLRYGLAPADQCRSGQVARRER